MLTRGEKKKKRALEKNAHKPAMARFVRLAPFLALMLAACAATSELPQPRFLSQEGKMRLEAADLVFANGETVCAVCLYLRS